MTKSEQRQLLKKKKAARTAYKAILSEARVAISAARVTAQATVQTEARAH